MINSKDLCKGLVSGILLIATSYAHAIPTTYNFSITGTVLTQGTKTVVVKKNNGDVVSGPTTTLDTNAWGLIAGSTITAYGSFVADLGPTMSGTVLFDLNAFTTNGNILTIDMNGALAGGSLLLASDDSSYTPGGGAFLTFSNGNLTYFDYQKTTTPKFNSLGMYFDDTTKATTATTASGQITTTTYQALFGQWSTNSNLVASPVPEASTYAMMLAGLGLVGWMGSARRKTLSLQG